MPVTVTDVSKHKGGTRALSRKKSKKKSKSIGLVLVLHLRLSALDVPASRKNKSLRIKKK